VNETNMNKTFQIQIKVALLFFVISALYGWGLRLYRVVDFIPIDYKNILQAHSHVTFLGWGFLAVISIIGFVYYPKRLENSKLLKRLFWILSFMLLGMLISFPLQGYKAFSIAFLSVFLIVSYVYLFQIFKELKKLKTISVKFIRTGILYYILSSIAIWAIAFIAIKIGKGDLYHNAIYFYLHFLYNGFFVFVLFGLYLKYLENKQIIVSSKQINFFYLFTNLACIPAYALSLLWSDVPGFVYFIGFGAGLLQVISLFYLYPIAKKYLKNNLSKQVKFISLFVLFSYFLKITMQLFSSFPSVIKSVVQLKSYFVIGYIHLFTLGFMSLFLILFLILFTKTKINKLGVMLFIIGILYSEILLFAQGVLLYQFTYIIPYFDINILIFSGFMPFGLLVVLLLNKNYSSTNSPSRE